MGRKFFFRFVFGFEYCVNTGRPMDWGQYLSRNPIHLQRVMVCYIQRKLLFVLLPYSLSGSDSLTKRMYRE